MSERTFRAVVAAVLVGALVLAAIVAFAMLQPPTPSPAPGPTLAVRATPTARPTPAPTPTPTPGPVFGDVGIVGVGNVPRGGASGPTLVLRFLEPSRAAIPDAEGSFTVALTDATGTGTTLAFTGTPSIVAPGSLGARAGFIAGNVLRISILGSDPNNVELITVTGLGVSASTRAALGPIGGTLGDFTGSLAGGVANVVLGSPGTVVAGP
jgi:hypothetical protein